MELPSRQLLDLTNNQTPTVNLVMGNTFLRRHINELLERRKLLLQEINSRLLHRIIPYPLRPLRGIVGPTGVYADKHLKTPLLPVVLAGFENEIIFCGIKIISQGKTNPLITIFLKNIRGYGSFARSPN